MKHEQTKKQHRKRVHRVPDEHHQNRAEHDPLEIAHVQICECRQASSQGQTLVPRCPHQTRKSVV